MPTTDELIETLPGLTQALRDEIAKAIVGQERVVEDVLLGLYCGEHVLLTGVPGLAKTFLIRSLSEALHLDFSRIQFTPDLMPADITGTEIIQDDPVKGTRELKFMEGPVFTNLLLADEIKPDATQDPGRDAADDAGTRGDRGLGDLASAKTVPRVRHPEPDRNGRHLPAPRGRHRPLHAVGDDRLCYTPPKRWTWCGAPPAPGSRSWRQ